MLKYYQKFKSAVTNFQDVPQLFMRLLLAYGFYHPALNKIINFEGTVYWFEQSLNIPFPALNAFFAASTEAAGVILLVLGLGTRLISIPLIFVMLMAIFTVHIDNGWHMIAQSDLNPEVANRLDMAREILKEYGNYEWLTEKGSFVILQNGVEITVTYIILLLSLITVGPGRISLDYVIGKKLNRK